MHFNHPIFSATVTNLQAKVENLQTTNALMKEDLAISKNQILALQEESEQMKGEQSSMQKEHHRKLEVGIYVGEKKIHLFLFQTSHCFQMTKLKTLARLLG